MVFENDATPPDEQELSEGTLCKHTDLPIESWDKPSNTRDQVPKASCLAVTLQTVISIVGGTRRLVAAIFLILAVILIKQM